MLSRGATQLVRDALRAMAQNRWRIEHAFLIACAGGWTALVS
jgi:hypothetical protein